jgi:hypothetical protein
MKERYQSVDLNCNMYINATKMILQGSMLSVIYILQKAVDDNTVVYLDAVSSTNGVVALLPVKKK